MRRVVLRHLPASAQIDEGDFKPSFAHYHARWICTWYERGSEAFRRSEDSLLASDIIRKAESLRNGMLSLSGPDSDGLRYVYRTAGTIEHELLDVVEVLDLLIKSGRSPASGIPHYSQADKKRNWRSMAVAEAARRAWGTEIWRQQNGTPDFFDLNVLTEMHKVAPTSQHHDRPGPFGRFLNDLMETLEILEKTGAPVSAATALNALRAIDCP